MNTESQISLIIKKKFPKLYVKEIVDNNLRFQPEQTYGSIEYKRTLVDCNISKEQKYATQMRWRINENLKTNSATYYIGIDDNGTIMGLTDSEIITCINRFVSIASNINASITGIKIIQIKDLKIIKANVKIKKIINNYVVDF